MLTFVRFSSKIVHTMQWADGDGIKLLRRNIMQRVMVFMVKMGSLGALVVLTVMMMVPHEVSALEASEMFGAGNCKCADTENCNTAKCNFTM